MFFELLLSLSLRFFLFDFILFKGIREYLQKKGYFFRKLFNCPFCQGFWCGLGVFFFYHPVTFTWQSLLTWLSFGFVSAYLGLAAAVILHPLIQKYERDSGMPLQ
ncbi:MAG TPA: DUF1360 domain-containing protein [Peptococcaceae bacterium]|nr:DUF1360 domain-containing protein [Peptococcaceae bacterium]